ncbi:UvrD-helicase domain-containing protein [Clostridium butyricum]|uniref:UvrD-helicase domain-containing protein n=1 Tax=Clostridium butyricum TaxID=1492 RepID=UPI0012B6D007|nr:ATP-dependent helicase [Clostridium butyricum]
MDSEIDEIIKKDHEGDEKQLEAIFSTDSRLVVEAPAGCGKTKTMVSKVSYMVAKNKVQQNKKILALTFSVNAAYKMKKDICDKLPYMGVEGIKTPADINGKIAVTNYHGFARRVLHLYGYLLDEKLKDIDYFQAINEEDDNFLNNSNVDDEEKQVLLSFSNAVKCANLETIEKYQNDYYRILKDKLFDKKYITYNGYLFLCKKILQEYNQLKIFYQRLYPVIIIDEFQDTNILSWNIVQQLVGEHSQLFFMGDSLQRIYGFIGAIPNILDNAVEKYAMSKITLDKNYRFRDNNDMLLLDRNIRLNAENFLLPRISEQASVTVELSETQEEEAQWVVSKVLELLENEKECKVAILVKQRGSNIDVILNELKKQSIEYFYALFSDEDDNYIKYHEEVLGIFFNELTSSKTKSINRTFLNKVQSKISDNYKDDDSQIIFSLLKLTDAFFYKILKEYKFLNNEERISFINDTFKNRALKQNMDDIDSRVVVSTVHGAKGLEWEYVLLPDMEPYIFPNYNGLCGKCDYRRGRRTTGDYCRIVASEHYEKDILEELSVFYVAITRAKKQVFFSASKKRYNARNEKKNSYISCFLTLPGIQII